MRLVDRVPLHPALFGLVVATVLVAIYLLVESLGGGRILDPSGDAFAGLPEPLVGFIIAAVAAGYALGAGYMINSQNAAALRDLRPLLAEPTRELVGRHRVTLGASRVVGCIGLVCGILFVFAVDETAARLLALEAFSSDALLSVLVLPLAFWLFARAAYFSISGMQSVTDIVERSLSIDLLDLSRLAPLGQMALRAALLWIGAAVVTSFSVLPAGGSVVEFLAVAFLLAVATATFVIPVRGVHRKMRDAKRAELLGLRAEIRRDRESVRVLGSDGRDAAARLPALLAYESRVQSVQEWPFDTPTLLRFALYLTIPVASWLGGAFVERFIDSALG
jgi:uncharacterized membrane protein